METQFADEIQTDGRIVQQNIAFHPAERLRATGRGRLPGQLLADGFAGFGGASKGMARAARQPVDIAINHWDHAVEVHRANHPETAHYCQDIARRRIASTGATSGRRSSTGKSLSLTRH